MNPRRRVTKIYGRLFTRRLLIVSLTAAVLALFPLIPPAGDLRAAEYYVTPGGSPRGNGSRAHPWDLRTALHHPARVRPGDVIWLRGGKYAGTYQSLLTGTEAKPIVVRQFPGERATIDGGDSNGTLILLVDGAYTWFWGFEVTSSDPGRVSAQPGSWVTDIKRGEGIFTSQEGRGGKGCRFINLYIHDARQGIGFWKDASDAELYGCIIAGNGWCGPDKAHGHGLYAQNSSGTKKIIDNIVMNNFSHGIQIYGSETAPLDNFVLEGNIVFGHAAERNILIGGGAPVRALVFRNNYVYGASGTVALDIGWNQMTGAGADKPVIEGNYLVGRVELWNVRTPTFTGNTIVGATLGFRTTWYPDNTYVSERAEKNVIIVRPNAYEKGRAHIVVFNWENATSVGADCSGVLNRGERYVIHDVLDFRGPAVASGTYTGVPVTIPLRAPPGYSSVKASCYSSPVISPAFGVFVLDRDTSARK